MASPSTKAVMSKFSYLPRASSGPVECPYVVSWNCSFTIPCRGKMKGLVTLKLLTNKWLVVQGLDLIRISYLNKGPAFSVQERKDFKLHGLLPPNIQSLDEQVKRAYEQYKSRRDDLAKNMFMAGLKAQYEVLYYKVVSPPHPFLCLSERWFFPDLYNSSCRRISRKCSASYTLRQKVMPSRTTRDCSEDQKAAFWTSKTRKKTALMNVSPISMVTRRSIT